MENLEALNQVVSALGGTEEGKTNAEAIGKIAEKVPDAVLPSTSEASEGDVLTVVSGKWAAQAPSGGGGGAFTVKLTEDDQNNWSSDKTFAQIKTAIEGGQAVSALVYSGTDLICIAPMTWFDFTEGDGMVTFCAMTVSQANNRLGALYYYVEEDNSVTATPLYYTLTPSD